MSSLYYVYYVIVIVLMLLEIHTTYVNIQQQSTYVVYMHFDHKCSSDTMQFSNEDLLPHISSAYQCMATPSYSDHLLYCGA